MFRRIVSIFAIIGFVAGQLAAMPHAHAGMTMAGQAQHDATPHVHCHGGHSHSHSHGHVHSHVAEREAPSVLPAFDVSEGSHDDDAVYLPGKMNSAPSAKNASAKAATDASLVAYLHTSAINWPKPFTLDRWHPPDSALDLSGLYLTLRNLRI
jgi:hypothetical protein